MSKACFRLGMCLLALTILAVQTNAARAADEEEQEREVTLKEVPAKVKAAILKAAGKNEVKEVEEVVLKLYEVEWTKGKRETEIFITPDGKVLMKNVEEEDEEAGKKEENEEKEAAEKEDDEEVDEKEITIDQLPAKVKATVEKLAKGNDVKLEELHMKFYEAMWLQDGKEVEILVAADGKLVKPEGKKAEKEGAGKDKKKDKGKKDKDDEDEKEDND